MNFYSAFEASPNPATTTQPMTTTFDDIFTTANPTECTQTDCPIGHYFDWFECDCVRGRPI